MSVSQVELPLLNGVWTNPMIMVFDDTESPEFFNAQRWCLIVSIKFSKVSGVSLFNLG